MIGCSPVMIVQSIANK